MKKILISFFQSIAVAILFLAVLEGICFLTGVPQGGARYTEAVLVREKLSARKSADEIRIFTYGESPMHGSHYWPYSNPARWLEVYLKEFLPDKKVRVINFARMGQGSH